MKFIFFLIFFNLVGNLSTIQNNDSAKYALAYNYILEDTLNIEKIFHEDIHNNIQMCFSNEIVYIPKFIFLDDMIEYEYPCLEKNQKSNLSKELFKSDMLDSFSSYIDTNFIDVTQNHSCNLKVFFSKIIEDKLMVTVLQSSESDDYSEVYSKGYTFLFYLFYFKNDKIEKIMQKHVYR
ncbi:MAG: hypothetical protein ABI462_00330 [Ignavibacteria bacterium]